MRGSGVARKAGFGIGLHEIKASFLRETYESERNCIYRQRWTGYDSRR